MNELKNLSSSEIIISTERLPQVAELGLQGWNFKNGVYGDKDLENARVIMTWPQNITKDILRKAKRLEVIQTFSAGADDIPYSEISEKVRLLSNGDAYSVSVAEHAWSLILAIAKGVCKKDKMESRNLLEKNLAVLGAGGIGSRIAIAGKGFGMNVIGLSRSFEHPESFDEKYYTLDNLIDVLTVADVIVCALPLNKYTSNLLRYENLRLSRPQVMIVNIARAEIFDKDGMYRLLKERPETRFATDVFWRKDGKEVFESKLWSLDNFVGTKHIAGFKASAEVRNQAMILAASNVHLYLTTGQAKNEVKRADYN